jgi:putative ABC transport system permease protein
VANAIRALLRRPAVSVLAITVLVVGIAAGTAMFSVVNVVLLRPLAYRDPDRLFEIQTVSDTGREAGVLAGDFERLSANGAIASATLGTSGAVTLTGPEGAENVFSQRLAGDRLAVFGTIPVIGRFDEGGSAVVISHRLWQRRYQGDPRVVGRVIALNGRPWTIAAVMPPRFQSNNPIFDLWMPWDFSKEDLGRGGNRVVRLRDAVPLDRAAEAFGSERAGAARNLRLRLTSLRTRQIGTSGATLWVLLGAVGCLLLIACLNSGSLLLARALARRQETAVRAALGAGPGHLLRPVLAESAVVAAIAGSALAWVVVRALPALLPERAPMPRLDQVSIDGRALAVALAAAVVSVLVASMAPALAAIRIRPAEALGEGSRSSTGGRAARRFRAASVVLQTALSVILLAAAGLLLRSLLRMVDADTGYQREGVLTARIPMPYDLGFARGNETHDARYRAVLDAVRSIPGVRHAAVTTSLPLGRVSATISFFPVEGRPEPKEEVHVQFQAVSPEYFRAMGIRLIAGRYLDERDTANAPPVLVINEVTAKKFWPGEDPVGRRAAGRQPVTVVGVVAGGRRGSMREPPEAEIYRPFPQFSFGLHGTTLVIRTAGPPPESLADPVRRVLRDKFPNYPVAEVRSMEEVIADSVAAPRFQAVLLASFAALALLLAAAGLYALIAHGVAERRREIGIRVALGASPAGVAALFVSRGLGLVAAGLAAGVAAAIAATRLLRSQLYEVEPGDPLTLVASVLLAVSVTAMLVPARRAARVDPAFALRAE